MSSADKLETIIKKKKKDSKNMHKRISGRKTKCTTRCLKTEGGQIIKMNEES